MATSCEVRSSHCLQCQLKHEHGRHRALGNSKWFLKAQWPQSNSKSNDNVHVAFLEAGSSPLCGHGFEHVLLYSVPHNTNFLQHLTQIPDSHRLGTVVLWAHMRFSVIIDTRWFRSVPVPTVIFIMCQLNTHLDWTASDYVILKAVDTTSIRILSKLRLGSKTEFPTMLKGTTHAPAI